MPWFPVDSTNHSAWISDRHTIWRNISGNNAACSNHTACPDFNPGEYDNAPANPAPVPDLNWQCIYLAKVLSGRRSVCYKCQAALLPASYIAERFHHDNYIIRRPYIFLTLSQKHLLFNSAICVFQLYNNFHAIIGKENIREITATTINTIQNTMPEI